MSAMFTWLAQSNLTAWVSTPSFANMCLVNACFNASLLPGLRIFLFCGEVLTNETARKLYERFPDAKVVNTYGPTESTVAVTEVLITHAMINSQSSLPMGREKPGTKILVMDEAYKYPGIPEGEKGEIVICGNTVANGYLNQKALTEEKFFTINTQAGMMKAYKTGDEGYLKNGHLYFSGRMDFQLKINGYRIELGDIESNIQKLGNILYCVVLPLVKNGENKGLAALVVPEQAAADEFEYAQRIRKELGKLIPHYMIPKKFVFLKEMPMTNNGKADRRQLQGLLEG